MIQLKSNRKFAMKKVLVTGSLAYDFIMDFPDSFESHILPEKLKTLSVSFLVDNFSKNFGGVAGNIAYNLSLLGTPSAILASAGKNDFAPYLLHIREANVDHRLIKAVTDEFTANMFVMTDKNNCQIAGFYPGAMKEDANLKITTAMASQFDFLIISPTMPSAMSSFVKQAKKWKLTYLYDPAQQIPQLSPSELIAGIDGAEILIGNDYELSLIMKKTKLTKKEILQKVNILITTLGEEGSLIETKGETLKIGIAKPKTVVDPTGAGDAYIAGFLSGYLEDKTLKIAGQIGATAAVYAIENYGTQKHTYTKQQFQKRYKEMFT